MHYRAYLNTTAQGTPTVSEWLDGVNVVHKRGVPGWAANRRDAIVIYAKASGPRLEQILDALADYQDKSPALFVNERVRLTRPAFGRRDGESVKLVGVGIADEVKDPSRSFSGLAAETVLAARKAAAQTGPGTFERHLADELERAGRAPGDPSREHYILTVAQRAVVRDRHVTGAEIMAAAGFDSTTQDLYALRKRIRADDLIFVRRDDKFGIVDKDAPDPPLQATKRLQDVT